MFLVMILDVVVSQLASIFNLMLNLRFFRIEDCQFIFGQMNETELDRQEPVDTALCAFLTVNVVKSSGTLRICRVLKPLIRYLIVDQHPP